MSILQLGKVLAKPLLKRVFKSQGAKIGGYVIGGATAVFGGTVGYQKVSECNEDRQNHGLFSKKQEIWEDQDINLLDRTWRTVKSWFSDQDVESKTRKYLDNEYTNDPEELQRAGREYIKELLGPDIKNLTPKEKEKRYREALREFYMQLTSLGLDEERSEQILAGAIGELQADTRSRAVKDFIELGASTTSINNRAKFAQQCALFNLTNKDAFDKFPDQQQAVEYQFQTFSHMRDIDVQQAVNNLNQVKDIYKKLREKNFDINCLSDNEKKLLQGIEDPGAIKQNYLTGGYAGAYAGIPANGYLLDADGNPNTAFVQELLSQIYNATEDLGISNEVFGALNEFMNSHSDALQQIRDIHGKEFESLMNAATGDKYSEYLRTGSVTGGGGDIEGSGGTAYKALGDRTGKPARSTGDGNNNITETGPGAAHQLSENPDAGVGEPLALTHHDPENAPITNPMDKVQRYLNPAIKRENSSADDEPVCNNIEEAVNKGVKAVKKYVKDNHWSDYTAFSKIMQTNPEGPDVYDYAIELFGRLDPGLQVCAFSWATATNQHELYVKMNLANKMKLDLDKCNLSPDLKKRLEEIRTNEIHNLHLENVYQEENLT